MAKKKNKKKKQQPQQQQSKPKRRRMSFSQAVSDVALVLRYIWIRAGGIDQRPNLPGRRQDLLLARPNR